MIHISGTSNLTIGSTNSSTVTFESGAATGQNNPSFYAYRSSNQSISSATVTKIELIQRYLIQIVVMIILQTTGSLQTKLENISFMHLVEQMLVVII